MNKREFLAELAEALSYELPKPLVDSNIRYYSEYIDGEARKGRAVSEILSELGDPKLIARSVTDAVKSGADGIPGTADDVSFDGETAYERQPFGYGSFQSAQDGGCDTFDESGKAACDAEDLRSGASGSRFGHLEYQSSSCLGCLFAVLVAGILLSLFGWFVGGVFALLSPVLGPLCLVLLIVWLLKKR